MSPLTLLFLLRAAAWVCVALLAVLTLLPAEEMVRTSWGGRVEHAVAYAGTTTLMRLSYRRRQWLWQAAALVGYAGLLELLQHFSHGRHPAVDDWAAGSAGVLLGIAAADIALFLRDWTWRRWGG